MPLAVQALLPFILLSGGAAAVRLHPFRRQAGGLAALATAAAAGVAATLLLRLAPAERVDIPYVRTFPLADLAIGLDALSAVFGLTLLVTACLLMVARLSGGDDRRQPWSAWLMTTAAALAIVFAANLVLIYVFLQVLTLAWSGALDETAPRGLRLRMMEQVADIGLLVVAGVTTAAVGTTALSGLPSDALGPAVFLLALLPVAVRVLALGRLSERPRTPVLFEPAIARAAVAGYLLLRLISIAGGQPPGRSLQVLIFAVALGAGAIFCAMAWGEQADGAALLRLIAAQAAIATALSVLGTPLGAVAGVWTWLGVIGLAGLATVRHQTFSTAGAVTGAALAVLPPGFLFIGLWLGTQSLIERQLIGAVLPLWLVAGAAALAAARRVRWPVNGRISVPTVWGAGLLALGAFPGPVLTLMAIPAARVVRTIPGGTVSSDVFVIRTGTSFIPQLAVSLTAIAALVVWSRIRSAIRWPLVRVPLPVSIIPVPPAPRVRLAVLQRIPWLRVAWLVYGAVVALAIALR
jgi:hypothetical protein